MGMAASQARYLALTARKTNCEYEGQQINQARTALANQSANYFNQLLNTKVPTCPDSTDFTKTQYSYSDGYNDSVLDSWHQLSNADKEYNYVVDTYYYSDVYTGSKRKINNPEVLFKNVASAYEEYVESLLQNADGSYTLETGDEKLITYKPLKKYKDSKDLQNALKDLEAEGILVFPHGKINYDNLYGYKDSGNVWHITTKENLDKAQSSHGLNPGYVDISKLGIDVSKDPASWTADDYQKVADALYAQGLIGITSEDIAVAISDGAFETGYAHYTATTGEDGQTRYDFESATKDEAYKKGEGGLEEYATSYDPQYVGNCKLTELTDNLTEVDETALLQIIADLPKETISEYIKRKPDGTYEYVGAGIYSFEYQGYTRYTTYKDLIGSLTTYDEYGKPIENQQKLAFFDATYINTKINETSKAMLDTDGKGRFKTMKLEDDSVVYTLNVEQVTDEDAYNDAMNKYYYQVRKYEKTIADINAKTEIIQKEDRTLELRLKQLDTEQNALQTEMEAVKKVISKNVETTFKTFAGG